MDLAALDQGEVVVFGVLVDLVDDDDVKPDVAQHLGSARGRVERVAQLFELLRDLADLALVLVADGDEDAALLFHAVSCGDKPLEQRLFERARDAQDLAG